MRRAIAISSLIMSASACFHIETRLRQDAPDANERYVDASHVAVLRGFQIAPVASGLTFPAGITFDELGTPYVIEAGFSYGDAWAPPRLIRLEPDGRTQVIATGTDAPWTGVEYANGSFFVAAGGPQTSGKILRIDPSGSIEVLVDGLPGYADHHVNGPVVGPDGMIYFSQGVATNSAIVGLDNVEFGWVAQRPDYHDIPCQDVKLAGRNFETDNPLTPDPDDRAITGAYLPFGTPSQPNQIVAGAVPCTGAVMRVRPQGGEIELVAWGFRNPFGLAFAPDGKLYVTDNGYDERGSRPVFASPDWLWEVDTSQPPLWYGWPDYAGGIPLGDRFDKSTMKEPTMVLAEHPNKPPHAKASFAVHASADGIDFAPTDRFAPRGTAFVAEFGDMAPKVGRTVAPVGFRVVMVDPATGVISPFLTNVGDQSGPASRLKSGGLERPVDVGFTRDGESLYIVDFGILGVDEKPMPIKNTGVVWRATAIPSEAIARR
jgi:glucose/arabinose dehydrogenase